MRAQTNFPKLLENSHHGTMVCVCARAEKVPLLGGWSKMRLDSAEVQAAAQHALKSYNTNSKSKRLFKLVDITAAQSQVSQPPTSPPHTHFLTALLLHRSPTGSTSRSRPSWEKPNVRRPKIWTWAAVLLAGRWVFSTRIPTRSWLAV